MTERGADPGPRGRSSARGEGALSELAQILLDNPLLKEALNVALEARDRASQASASAMRGVGVSSSADVDRLGRRLRALSERLEAVEDTLDRLVRELEDLRRASSSTREP